MSVDVWSIPLRPASHVVGRQLDESFFLLNLDSNTVFELNATGTEIWLWLERNQSLSGCEDHLCAKFSVSQNELHEQVGLVVEQLVREGLLVDATAQSNSGGSI